MITRRALVASGAGAFLAGCDRVQNFAPARKILLAGDTINGGLQRALIDRPGNREIMLALLYDYRTNLAEYPKWHAYFREHRPPMLIVWGRNDAIFPPSGARAYLRDLPDAELHLLDTGHFALEEKCAEIARLMRGFLARHVEPKLAAR